VHGAVIGTLLILAQFGNLDGATAATMTMTFSGGTSFDTDFDRLDDLCAENGILMSGFGDYR